MKSKYLSLKLVPNHYIIPDYTDISLNTNREFGFAVLHDKIEPISSN